MSGDIMAGDGVVVEVRDHAMWIRLNRAERLNALDWDAWEAFSAAWRRLIEDDDIWLGVVIGEGDRAFCAGADLKKLPGQIAERRAAGDPNPIPPMAFNDQVCDKPVIAAVNGDALGGGLELALACDLRIAVEDARLGLPEAKWGGLPGAGGTQRLPRAIPRAVALELLFTGRFLTAAEAAEVGLVNKVVPRDQLIPEVESLVERILTMSPLALRGIKRAVVTGGERSLAEGIALERRELDRLMETEDYRKGIGAFAEGRKPVWTGK